MNKKTIGLFLAGSITALACSVSLFGTPTPQPNSTPAPATATHTPAAPSATQPAPSPTIPAAAPTNTSPAPSGGGLTPGAASGPYAVVNVQPNDVLNVRSGPGVGYGIIGSFAPNFTGVMRTGPSAWAGGSLWVEVQNPSGGKGWVNSSFLSEYVTSAGFCNDAAVTTLLNSFKAAVLDSNGAQLAGLTSPAHGVDVRFFRYVDPVNYDVEHAKFVFETTFQVNWGPQPGSGEDLIGSFHQIIVPSLQDVLGDPATGYFCNQIKTGGATYDPVWPYPGIHFYSIYFPGTDAYGGLDWETWLTGIHYVQGKPYLYALIHMEWEP